MAVRLVMNREMPETLSSVAPSGLLSVLEDPCALAFAFACRPIYLCVHAGAMFALGLFSVGAMPGLTDIAWAYKA